MAYKKNELIKTSIEAIKKHNLYFIEDVVAYLPCGKTTFFKYKLNDVNEIKDALDQNKINAKVKMRSKWYKSDHPTLQLALMKLIGTKDEAHRLNGTKQEIKQTGAVTAEVITIQVNEKKKD